MKPSIVFTGGGTSGHVTPNLALIEVLKENWQIGYIGSAEGIEKDITSEFKIPFYPISTGKLRRYFSWKNFTDPLRIMYGIGQSYFILRKLKANIVFSKGGFVGFPVVVAAWLNRIPVISHESDMTPGLANRLSFPFTNKLCVTFAATEKHIKEKAKVEVTGTPIRSELFQGSKEKGLALCGFSNNKPCLLMMGGGQGSSYLNGILREALDNLLISYQVIHLCGKGKIDESLQSKEGYCQFEYVNQELADLMAAAELVISRSGANSLCEILALEKPHVLIPLSAKKSRGDQIQNARYFKEQGISRVIAEEELDKENLIAAIDEVYVNRDEIIEKMQALNIQSATTKIISLIEELYAKQG